MVKIFKIISIISIFMTITFASYAVDLNELQEQRNEIQNKITESNEELTEVNEELTDNLIQIQKLDESIENTEKSLNELNTKINEIEKKIDKIEVELDKVTKKYNRQKELLDQRLVALYETGNTTYLDVLLDSSSITDFLSKYYLIGELASYDTDLLNIVDEQKKDIEAKQTQITEEKESLETEKNTQRKTQIALSNTKLLRENYISKLSIEEQEIQTQIDDYNNQINLIEQEIINLATTESFGEDYVGGPMIWPIPNHYTITSNYGMRTHPITGVYKLHTGVDISAGIGTDFVAMAYGVVVKAEYNNAYGNMVIIDHGGGVQTLYAHGSQIVAELGQVVNPGDVILKVGSTGYSTGPHAHFEIRINGATVNPLDYVSIPEQENN